MKKSRTYPAVAVLLGGFSINQQANALAVIDHGENQSTYISGGIRASYNTVEDGAPNGSDRSNDFALDNLRLYLGGQVREKIYWELNTEIRDSSDNPSSGLSADNGLHGPEADDIELLDAIVKYAYSEALNIWFGRQVLNFGRNGASGPFGMNAWDYPIADRTPFGSIAGRDDGVRVWGHIYKGGIFWNYHAGIFDGSDNPDLTGDDSNRFMGGLKVNFWDDEGYDPQIGLYHNNTYFGEKDVLALSIDVIHDPDALGTATSNDDYIATNVSLLLDKKLANEAVATLELQYFNYSGGNANATDTFADANGYLIRGGYLFPEKMGIGQFRPIFSIEEYDPDTGSNFGGLSQERWTAGFDYIIDGHSAKLNFTYGEDEFVDRSEINYFRIGAQLLF